MSEREIGQKIAAELQEMNPTMSGHKIIDGLKDAIAGSFSAVTIEGQRWVRADHAQGARITDAMCEAAVKADLVDRIQGFGYKTHYVIRDVWLDYSSQAIWKISKDDAEAEERFRRQCGIERMRKILEAALAVSEGDRG